MAVRGICFVSPVLRTFIQAFPLSLSGHFYFFCFDASRTGRKFCCSTLPVRTRAITWTCFQSGYVFDRRWDTPTRQGDVSSSFLFFFGLFVFAKSTLKQSGRDKFQRGRMRWSPCCYGAVLGEKLNK